jgi:hypothetical protein
METSFEQRYGDRIVGTLTMIDRMIVNGYVLGLFSPGAFTRFLGYEGVRVEEFSSYVQRASQTVRTRAKQIAEKSGRPFTYLAHAAKGKDKLAKQIAERDGIKEGLICVFSTLEMRNCFAVWRYPQQDNIGVGRRMRKCLHLYFYLIDRELGFMYVRLQTWFPFEVQIYVNGHEWLAKQLDRRGVAYERYDNALLQIEDLKLARKLCEGFVRRKWSRVWDAFARRVNPWLKVLVRHGMGGYYWVTDQCEIATDVMWRDRASLASIVDDLFDHAIRAFSADDVMRFLGREPSRRFKGEVVTDHKRRPEGRRIKHRLRRNWLKFYDKYSVLRIETTINNPREFKVLKVIQERRGRKHRRWVEMGKGVANLWRYFQVGERANRRYLQALAQVQPERQAIVELDRLCHGRVVSGRRCARFNPVSAQDCELFKAVLHGPHAINGLRNRDLTARLYPTTPRTPDEAGRHCARVSRLIAKLRGHALLAKVPGSRLYRVTPRGQRVMSAALRFRNLDFPTALAEAA